MTKLIRSVSKPFVADVSLFQFNICRHDATYRQQIPKLFDSDAITWQLSNKVSLEECQAHTLVADYGSENVIYY